ncbi:MAG: hypothetical protein QOD87_1220, partial [Pseudonocardiales bacterium]|nr:hypothetical protein [Pseudonocardiales bacterium]
MRSAGQRFADRPQPSQVVDVGRQGRDAALGNIRMGRGESVDHRP